MEFVANNEHDEHNAIGKEVPVQKIYAYNNIVVPKQILEILQIRKSYVYL